MLHLLYIDSVVFSVRTNKADVDDSVLVVDLHDQSIVISFDVEHCAAVLEDRAVASDLRRETRTQGQDRHALGA
jgi:hypothetical protein